MAQWQIIEGDCREVLRSLPARSVHTCVTSPPYFGLRDYGNAGQIGLEPTPDEFVAALVAVFREVRRVLRDDGTVWLNLGDSYASNPGSGYANGNFGGLGENQTRRLGSATFRAPDRGQDIKLKDLLGIPWMVAFALRQPYYDGAISREVDRVWLAAMLDAEGNIAVNFQRGGEHRARTSYSVSVKVHNTSRAIVERCPEIAGCGSVRLHDTRNRECFAWSVYGDDARRVLREVYPHLVAKRQEARIAYAPSTEAAYEAVCLLHRGSDTTLDAPAPPECWTPGWYLRSDIIWAKPNPMPESVTDRPTKAHEYLFLLSKSAKYAYDADAIREADSGQDHEHRNVLDGQASLEPSNGLRSTHGGLRTVEGRNGSGRNKRSVWTIATQPYAGAHFATFPPKLIEPCILAGAPERACGECGAPWERVVEHGEVLSTGGSATGARASNMDAVSPLGQDPHSGAFNTGAFVQREHITKGFGPSCTHNAEPAPGVVLDPFTGAGTTGVVALRHNRGFIGIELNAEYADLARWRIRDDAPLLNQEEVA